MSFAAPRATKAPTVQKVSNNDWLKGTVTAFDSGRTPVNGLSSATNVMLNQDGTVGPRPSLRLYGPQPTGTVLGQIFEFKVQSGLTPVYWQISLQNVAGTTQAYIAKGEDSSWTVCTGKTFDNTAKAHFLQIQSKILIMNGVDTLSYLDIPTSAVIPYTALTNPSAPTMTTLTGLTGTSYNVYYAISANSSVGETTASAVLTQAVSTARDLWNPSTQNIKISWTTVTGVKSWNVYMGVSADGAGVPTMYAIATGLDATILTFTDDGSRAQDLSRPKPTTNSTAGPKVSRGAIINGRAWLVGDKDNPYYVRRGGDYGFELDFSPANGGGFTPLGNGSKDVPVSVFSNRTGRGDPAITVLSQSSNGKGKRFLLSPTTVTYGSSTFVVWQVQEDSSGDGTDSPDGVIYYENSFYYPSRDGFKTTGTKPQLQNVLSTDRISNTIQKDITRLTSSSMPNAVGVAYEGRLYWSLPVGTTTNSELWTLDIVRGGAWMNPWSIVADWLWLYNDNSGVTHFCILQNNSIYEMTKTQLTNDNGTPFITTGNSGVIYFSPDAREWGKLIQVVFTTLHPQGRINYNITAMTDEGLVSFAGTDEFAVDKTVVGWGEPSAIGIVGWGRHPWSGIETVPSIVALASSDFIVEVDEECQWWTYGWSTVGTGVDYEISKVTSEFVNIGIRDLN